jgi:predicted O-linked N-acetylglucosamine transferase (SPINDLY family)
MPELIASTQEQYENLAVALAAEPLRLARIKQRLGEARDSAPLFDTPLFTRTLEAAYAAIYDRYQAGLPPRHVAVGARSEP